MDRQFQGGLKRPSAHEELQQEISGAFGGVIDASRAQLHWEIGQEVVLYLCSPRKNGGALFFLEMVTRWLVPSTRLDVTEFFAFDACHQSGKKCLFAKLVILEPRPDVNAAIERALPVFADEVALGLSSSYHAERILEVKGLSLSDKMAFVQERLRKCMQRFPDTFDYELIPLMQRFFIHMGDGYREDRSSEVLARQILSLFTVRKRLFDAARKKRDVASCVRAVRFEHLFGVQHSLALTVGITFLKDNELFKETHLEKAVQAINSDVQTVDGTFYQEHAAKDHLHLFSVELEKSNGSPFSIEEKQAIASAIDAQINARIEHLLKPLFMPRNEEEVMKQMILLSGQLTGECDIPQMILSFNEQSDQALFFTVILARCNPLLGVKDCIDGLLQVQLDKVRMQNGARLKKELSVLRVKVAVDPFIRDDGRVDFISARRAVHKIVEDAFGVVRDYYGGMYEKQASHFLSFCRLLKEKGIPLGAETEKFYHSWLPVEYVTVVPVELLVSFYRRYIHFRKNNAEGMLQAKSENAEIYLVRASDLTKKQRLISELHDIVPPSAKMLVFQSEEIEGVYLGCISLRVSNAEQERIARLFSHTA